MPEDPLHLHETIDFVREFHDAFKIPNNMEPTAHIEDRIIDLRFNLMKEENEEYLEAAKNNDLVEVADALGDMLYILCGTILSHGLQDKIEEVYREIQRSNMSKLDANGNPIYREDGKVMKSELYFKPDIKSILDV
jgi:predicted HAD superfamily Cof-like phosphohydrolase